MADGTATPDLHRKISVNESVYFTSNSSELPNTNYAEKDAIKQKAELAIRLIKKRAESNNTGRAVIDAAKESLTPKTSLSSADIQEMTYSFGADRVSLKLTDPQNTSSDLEESKKLDGLTDLQKLQVESSFKEGKENIQSISDFLSYTEILNEAQQRKLNVNEVANEYKTKYPERFKGRNFAEMRTATLTKLSQLDSIRTMLPEMSELSESEQADLLEKLLTSDPKLRKKVMDKANSIKRELRNLDEVKGNKKDNQTSMTKEEFDAQVKENVDSIISRLQAEEVNFDENILRITIQDKLTQGMTKDKLAEKIQDQLISSDTDYVKIKKFRDAQNTFNQANYVAANIAPRTPQASIDIVINNLRKAEQDLLDAQRDLPQNLDEKEKQMKLIEAMVSSVKGNELSELYNAKRDLDQTNKDAKKRVGDQNKDFTKSLVNRLEQEAEILSRLENVMEESVLELVDERYDEMIKAQDLAISDLTTDENKEYFNNLKDRMKRDQINKYNERDRRSYRDENAVERRGKDVRFLLYHGEGDEGVKKLLLRDTGFKKADGTTYSDYELKYLDLDSLPENQKEQLEGIYTSMGDEYKKRLFTEFFMARGVKDKFGVGKLSLKEHEWLLMQQHYGEYINKTIDNSPEASNTRKELQDKGIVIDSKMNILLFILGLLGIEAGKHVFKNITSNKSSEA